MESEKLRLAELESFDLDNSYPKEQLKSVIKLASEICGTSISLVDIIDEFNQRTIATHGDWEEKVIPREKSICDRVIVEGDLLIINDIQSNKEIASRLSKQDQEKIKFYAGAPLKSPNGFILGALCVIDTEPKELTELQKESLQVLADEVMARLQLHKKTKLLKKQTKELQHQNRILNKYSVFLNNSADILCIIDSQSYLILDINEDCDKELGFTRTEMLKKNFTDFVDSDIDIQSTVTSWFNRDTGNSKRLSLPVKLKNKRGTEKWYRCNFTSENNHWYLTARNITDQKKAEDRLKELRSKFEKVARATSDLIYELDWNSALITWGGDLTKILGYPESDRQVDFEWWQEKVHPDDVEEVMDDFMRAVDSDIIKWSATYRFRAFDGSYRYMLNNSHFDRDQSGSPKIILGALADITQLKKAEIRQRNLLSRLQHANHLAEIGFWELDLEKDSIVLDDEMNHIFGLKKKPENPSIKLILNRLNEEDKLHFLEFIQNINHGQGITEVEHKITVDDSKEKFLVHRGELIHEGGTQKKILITTQDITDRKLKEMRISESLREKEILLSEIHHRVKNNLAIISGLLEMNMYQVEDENFIDFIRSSQLRIQSMAKIHEKLYQSDSFTHISFKEYIQELIQSIQSAMATDEFEPVIKTNIEEIHLNINYAIPCGLILNELITNSWKHAFPNQEKGTIMISFLNEDEKIHLSVKDNGVGLPDEFNEEENQSLGLTLIKILSQQIEAQLSLGNSESGFSCMMTFSHVDDRKGSSSSFV
jgi:PAS domain S-box-containing protein